MKKPQLLVISLDAVSSVDVDLLLKCPNFRKLSKKGTLVREVDSVFISNTYPIHTSMLTGVYPKDHGIIDNVYMEYGEVEPHWRWYFSLIKRDNVITSALKKKYKIATIFWPVTALAPVKYRIAEIIARDHESQISVVLKNSTKLFTIANFLKYGKNVQGSKQPNLDDFSTSVTCELLEKQKAEFILLHLTDVDTTKHHHGIDSKETKAALLRMDERIGRFIQAAGDNYQLLLVSDHAQVDVENHLNINAINTFRDTWWHLSEGSAFLLEKGHLDNKTFKEIKTWISGQSAFGRFLTNEEMETSGFKRVSRLGISAKANWAFCFPGHNHIGNHGYPLDLPAYQPFYFVKGNDVKENQSIKGGTIMDVCPLILKLLNLPDFPCTGSLNNKIFNK